nr:TSUP family transporter [Marinicella sp. W31]MDC2879101.1 TSUP family transporter [Marinicella sp. W31]
MSIYLPIAELSVNIFVILGMGAAVGFLSGMFGVGGGFLITPLLIFYQIPLSSRSPPVQVRWLPHPFPAPSPISAAARST